MKHGVRPTRNQRLFLKSKRLNSDNWFVVKDEPHQMTLVHRHFENKIRVVPKGEKYND